MYKGMLEFRGGSIDFSRGCVVMGVLNVTPDSFSDGGDYFDVGHAVERGVEMAGEGSAIIDVGGESSRPGAEATATKEQIRRVVPVIKGLRDKVEIQISIDARDVEVARAALDAGAGIINDITALADEKMGRLAAERGAAVVLMHMQGTPATMQVEPRYKDVVGEVLQFLLERARKAENYGIERERIFIDPGIGFGKTVEHNLELLKHIDRFVSTGYRVLVGTSRKGFIGKITGREKAKERVFGTAATVAMCAATGVSVVRAHDVGAMVDVLRIVRAVKDA